MLFLLLQLSLLLLEVYSYSSNVTQAKSSLLDSRGGTRTHFLDGRCGIRHNLSESKPE